ncbi:MAG: hypothetical protein IKS83_00260 [Victivallales bacterium]|nr:hypothetical protein [Victivallales bacterium]
MQSKRFSLFCRMMLVLLMFSLLPAMLADETPQASASPSHVEAVANATANAVANATQAASPNAKFYAIAAAVAIGSMSAAYAVGKIGAAVMGAAAEKPEIMSKALPFVALGEGIALFGFLVAIFLLGH